MTSVGTSRTAIVDHHSWLDVVCYDNEYLPPSYYEKILKPYEFGGRSDLELFSSFLDEHLGSEHASVLEIGPGTGRATAVLLERLRPGNLDLVDQSGRMLEYCVQRFLNLGRVRVTRSDGISFLAKTTRTYDLVFSLWSLSHSVHQTVAREGLFQASASVSHAIRRVFRSVLRPSGKFFLIHFDTTSEEQRISLRQRKRADPWLRPGIPSPSQQVIERTLNQLSDEGLIVFDKHKLSGSPIIYSGLDEALEVFMNFHMEGFFNQSPERDRILLDLSKDLRRYECLDGTIRIRPGCLVYRCHRLATAVDCTRYDQHRFFQEPLRRGVRHVSYGADF